MDRYICLLVTCLMSAMTFAGTKMSGIKVNGMPVSKQVTEITMDDQSYSLVWNDNTTSQGKSAAIMVRLANPQCIDKVKLLAINGLVDKRLYVEGLAESTQVIIYNLQGIKISEQNVDANWADIDIEHLDTGIYLLKNQNTVLRFVKR